MNSYLLLLVAFAALGVYMWRRRRLYVLSWQLNGPIGYPIIGSAYIFRDATRKLLALNVQFSVRTTRGATRGATHVARTCLAAHACRVCVCCVLRFPCVYSLAHVRSYLAYYMVLGVVVGLDWRLCCGSVRMLCY